MSELKAAIKKKARAEYNLTCEYTKNHGQCSTGLVAATLAKIEAAFVKNGFALVGGKVYCDKHAPKAEKKPVRFLIWTNGYAHDGGEDRAKAVEYAQAKERLNRHRCSVTEHAGTLGEVGQNPAGTKVRDVDYEHQDQS